MNVLVASTLWPFQSGGSEILTAALIENLKARGHRAELILLPFFPRPASHLTAAVHLARAMEIGETNFGPIDRLITLKFPAYVIDYPHKTLWLVHQYRQMYDLWDEPGIGFASLPLGESLRAAVCHADRLHLPQHRLRFAISNTVAARLRDFCGIDAETLYPPVPNGAAYFCDGAEDYLLCPGRLSILKRQELVLRALALTKTSVRVRFVGGCDDEPSRDRFISLAGELGVAERAEYLGWIPESDLPSLYARSIGVVYPPRLEDLGFVTQEAMLSSKPVITCHDSAGVLEFVTHEDNGIVTAPEPAALAHALDRLWEDRAVASTLGRRGYERLRAMNLSWSHVVQRLLE